MYPEVISAPLFFSVRKDKTDLSILLRSYAEVVGYLLMKSAMDQTNEGYHATIQRYKKQINMSV